MDQQTKARLSYYWKKFKIGVAQGVTDFTNGVKTTFNNAKKSVESTIEKKKIEKQIRHNNEIDRYRKFVLETINNIDDLTVKNFLNDLGESSSELTYKTAAKYKQSFPVPKEQPILWALVSYETNRIGGIVVTKKGVFTKTVVNIFVENSFNKENRKTSELFYYPWEYFDPDIFIKGDFFKNLGLPNTDGINTFTNACKRYIDSARNYKLKTFHYYERKDNVINGAAAGIESSLMKDELKFTRDNGYGNNKAGFGLFAEKANNMSDRMHFKDAKVVGGDNVKNGPDRIVNGVNIQTKYYATGARSVGAAFDNKNSGLYRYWNSDGTPMKLEVPKGQGFDAIRTMRNKILNGKVKTVIDGKEYIVTDPNEAERIVVEGNYTYEQAVNISKAGTIESLTYDIQTGAVISTCVFGISFLINAFICYRKTHNLKKASIDGLIAGGKSGALALTTHVLVSQLSRTHTFSQIMTKNSILSGFVGAAAGFIVFSIPETYRLAFKKISTAQYACNLATLSASIIGGTVGAYVGTAALGPVGGVAGGIGLGAAAGIGTSKLIDIFYEGDDKRHSRLFNAYTVLLISEYLLDEIEIEKFVSKMNTISDREYKSLFERLNSTDSQEESIRSFLKPYLEEIVKERDCLKIDYKLLNYEAIK